MTPDKIRQIVREEIAKSNASSRFAYNSIPQHTHNGVDSPQLKAENILPSVSVSGNITFSASSEYTIYLNSSFTPRHIMAYGNITDPSTGRYISIGSANLGPSFFLQPDTTRTVVTGSIQYPFTDPNLNPITNVPLQSSVYFGAESAGGAMHTLSSEGHIVNVYYGSDIKARATITEFSKTFIKIQTTIDSGWDMNINYVIT
jgi:hypothetical protein